MPSQILRVGSNEKRRQVELEMVLHLFDTAGELKPNVQEVNVRGVKRVSNGEVRILIR